MIIEQTSETINILINELQNDKNICIPTDTIYGICAHSNSLPAIENIFHLKKRAQNKPLALLVNSKDMAKKYFKSNKIIDILMQEFWPGSLTIISEQSEYAKSLVSIEMATSGVKTIGIRFPKSELISEIISKLNFPIFATSVNFSDEDPLNSSYDIENNFIKKNNSDILVLKNPEKINNTEKASTVVQVTNNDIKILRDGEIAEKIKKIIF